MFQLNEEQELNVKVNTVFEIVGALAKELKISPKKLAKYVSDGEGEKTAVTILKEMIKAELEKEIETYEKN